MILYWNCWRVKVFQYWWGDYQSPVAHCFSKQVSLLNKCWNLKLKYTCGTYEPRQCLDILTVGWVFRLFCSVLCWLIWFWLVHLLVFFLQCNIWGIFISGLGWMETLMSKWQFYSCSIDFSIHCNPLCLCLPWNFFLNYPIQLWVFQGSKVLLKYSPAQ